MGDISDRDNLRAAIAEFIATFLFVFVGVGAIGAFREIGVNSGPELVLIGLAYGLAIAVGIMAVGRISGAQINPGVTIAALLAGKIGVINSAMYVTAQLGGSALAMVHPSVSVCHHFLRSWKSKQRTH